MKSTSFLIILSLVFSCERNAVEKSKAFNYTGTFENLNVPDLRLSIDFVDDYQGNSVSRFIWTKNDSLIDKAIFKSYMETNNNSKKETYALIQFTDGRLTEVRQLYPNNTDYFLEIKMPCSSNDSLKISEFSSYVYVAN